MSWGCTDCGYLTNDPSQRVCPNCATHPVLTRIGGDAPLTLDETPDLAPPPAEPEVIALAAPAEEAPAPEAVITPPAPPPTAADPAEVQTVLQELRALTGGKARPLVIGLMGFSTTGKTWFLRRLKHELCDDFEVEPPYHQESAKDADDIAGTLALGLHRFVSNHDRRLSFYVLDVPGEWFRQEMEAGFTGASLLEAIVLCNAYLFIMPAAEYLFADELHGRRALIPGLPSEESFRAQLETAGVTEPEAVEAARTELNAARKRQIDLMHASISRMAIAIAYVDAKGGVEAALKEKITPKALLDFADGKGRACQKPAALVLTMADRMQPAIDASASVDARLKSGGRRFDFDPLPILMYFRPGVLRRLSRCFRWWKVDFATASHGHEGGRKLDTERPQYGLAGLIDWIRGARREARWPHWLTGGTDTAIRWRRRINPSFAAAWKRAVAPQSTGAGFGD